MKRNLLSIIAAMMALIMIVSALASCTGGETVETDSTPESSETTEQAGGNETADTEPDNDDGDDDGDNDGGETVGPQLSGNHAEIVELADALKNNVTAYFPDGSRQSVVYENMEMSLEYALDVSLPQQVTSLKNKAGKSYIENTMDVFVRLESGNTFYAKDSYTDAVPNIYRFGYYYYHMRNEGQTFVKEFAETGSLNVDFRRPIATNNVKGMKNNKGVLTVFNSSDATDPYIVISQSLSADTSRYNMLEITMKANAATDTRADLFFIAGSCETFSQEQRISFAVNNDGEYHTYTIPLYSGADYNGVVKGLRLDVGGANAEYEISGMRFVGTDVLDAPSDLFLCRNFNVYSDKMHQVIQVAATAKTEGIKEIGIETRIPAEKVVKVVLEDANGIHYELNGIDWASVGYIGFDIVDAGIFGYILPYDGKGGKLSCTLADGEYVIEQTMTPVANGESGVIIPSRTDYNEENKYFNWVSGGNTNDFYIGNRIYTDASHDFTEFLNEAYCERNPLSEKNFKVFEEYSSSGKYSGYDSLRGCYQFDLAGAPGGFSTPYYKEPGKHYRVNFTVRGDDRDRKVYVLTHTTVGQLESAVLLDDKDVMIPVPLEVGKNFSEQGGERNLYNLDDATYGEVVFPMVIDSKVKYEYTVLNLYQNWGNYPLKQISWIQFFSPYYHLSTGVTETNCILPWMFTDRIWYNTLPDHRGMSAPHWAEQPQHTSSGEHDWLRYVDSEGNVVRWENVKNTIDSYGLTYADVKMDYVTYDGKMNVSYTHTEMPQTDENRSYYEMTYEVLEDITINNFVTDFQFYKVDPNDSRGIYKKLGYLDENNESVVVDANLTSTPVKYVLGDNCPYFSFFDMDNHADKNGYGNVAFLVYNSEFIIGGEKVEPNFAIVNYEDTVYVTLDIEEKTTLKAGDKITINAILLPWGSHLLEDGIVDEATNNYEYTMRLPDGTLYMDKNVRDVRENTLLNPIKVIAGENAKAIESVFVPKLKTTNGESAEFTLSGGYNNVAVRIYGFNRMTVPTIYEKIGGEWVKYEVSSKNAEKDPHNYDGYMIHYDGDGTFSYSFVTDMDGETDRTFKIVADGNYQAWIKEESGAGSRADHLNVFVDPYEIKNDCESTILAMEFAGKVEVITGERTDELDSYVRIWGAGLNAKYPESYATVYQNPTGSQAGGKYIAVKYRLPAENKEKIGTFEFYLSTDITAPADNSCQIKTNCVVADGEWHVIIMDLSKITRSDFLAHFKPASDGLYYHKFIRFDYFDRLVSTETCIDVGFVGLHDSIEEIAAASVGVSTISLVEGGNTYGVDPSTGEVLKNNFGGNAVLVDPTSGYTQASLKYGAQIDNINGVNVSLQAGDSNSFGVKSYVHNGKTMAGSDVQNSASASGTKLVLSGWCVIEGGVDRYVWSADGGKTWNEIELYNNTIRTANDAMIGAAYSRSEGSYTFTAADAANGDFQGSRGLNPTGIALELSAYVGKTVDIVFGAVPAKDTGSIRPLFVISKVTVEE